MTTRSLHSGWTVRPDGGPVPPHVVAAGAVPATVPGTVHTDLLAAGLVPDPYLDDNERLLAWIGLTDWVYETTLVLGPVEGDRRTLVLHGLDTVATVTVDGEVVLEAADQHRTHVLDVTGALGEGTHVLQVRFASAVRYADAQQQALGSRPHVNHHPFNAVRKMACNFGWDWGPDLVTAGIWRRVELVDWSVARVTGVRPTTTLTGEGGRLDVAVDLDLDLDLERDFDRVPGAAAPVVRVTVLGDHAPVSAEVTVAAGDTVARLALDVPGARPWWPRSHGDQPLSDLVVELLDRSGGEDRVVGTWTGRVGFREVAWVAEPDAHGTSFRLVVNGEPVLVRGVNWIPDDAFPHRVDRARYAARLAQAEGAGCNLVRVWGGGTYEDDAFYDECDERGLLVWQDVLLACASYAEEEPLRSELLAEVRDNATRLAPHPSLVLWCGGNENLWGFVDWDWDVRLDGRTWGAEYYHRLLPELLAELDPARPYIPGSPFSPVGPGGEERHPNDPAHGPVHVWDVWNERDWTAYREHRPRFVSEFGWQGPPAWSTLVRALSDDPLTPESPGMLVHQKAMEGQRKLERGLVPHLRVPDDMRDWHWAMSLNQAWAVRAGVEHLRSLAPVCAGSVVWQLNDCWPVTSWSAVDGDGRAKPTLHALRQAHADRLLTVQPRDGGLAAVLVNDTAERWSGPLVLRRAGLDGTGRTSDGTAVEVMVEVMVEGPAEVVVEVDVPARGTATVPVPDHLARPDDPTAEVLVAEGPGARGLWFFVEDRDLALRVDGVLTASVEPLDDGYAVLVEAVGLVKDLALLADVLDPDAVVDDMLLTLLPGERATVAVRCGPLADPDVLLRPDVLRSSNQLVRR